MNTEENYENLLKTARSARWEEIESWILIVGKYFQYQFEPEVREFLEHPRPEIVAEAIRSLGQRWQLDGFREECESMFLDPPGNPEIWQATISAWVAYRRGSRDMSLAVDLLNLAENRRVPFYVRSTALRSIGLVLDGSAIAMPQEVWGDKPIDDHTDFDQNINWDLLKTFMSRYAE